ncbi:MAG: type II toxin-antitoxin system VapC family toxin [Rhizobiaceae bacterium]
MASVIINDACCLIDLRKGNLLHVLCKLPYQFVVPLPIRESELLDFSPQEWSFLEASGMTTYDLPPEEVGEAFGVKQRHGRLSANDCFCLVATHHHENGILLTGDRLLRRVAEDNAVEVHGILWIIEQLSAHGVCERDLLTTALTLWREDRSVFVPDNLIDRQLRLLD